MYHIYMQDPLIGFFSRKSLRQRIYIDLKLTTNAIKGSDMTKREKHKQPKLPLSGGVDVLFQKTSYPSQFEFSEEVAQVFDDMVSRSVPLYKDVIYSLMEWTQNYYQPGSKIFDIGCSTGTTLAAIGSNLASKAFMVGIDPAPAMLAKAKVKLSELSDRHDIQLIEKNALDVAYNDASIAILNYTLQFIPVKDRQTLIENIYAGMRPGGLIFISEKVRSELPEFQEAITKSYELFKYQAGYTLSEIERKKEALHQILVPLTIEEQKAMLKSAGFSHCEVLFKWNSFVTYVAIKK